MQWKWWNGSVYDPYLAMMETTEAVQAYIKFRTMNVSTSVSSISLYNLYLRLHDSDFLFRLVVMIC